MSILGVLQWLEARPSSIALRESIWVYPIVETGHVLGLCLFLGLTLLLDLRLLGLAFRRISVTEMTERLLPWMTAGFVFMVITGLLLLYSDPIRFFGNIFFQVKVVMLALAGLNAFLFHRSAAYRSRERWEHEGSTPARARLSAAISLALWAGIVVAGRMIAYNWFDPNNWFE
jgi:hypothetical protein